MFQRTIVALLALLVAVPVMPALASHTNNYVTLPTEHDDQGRSQEPDFASTSILGLPVANKIFDPTPGDPFGALPDTALPPTPPGHSNVLAPGCTDDAGRQPSGLCGLWTIGAAPTLSPVNPLVPPKVIGVQGMSGASAPGRFNDDKSTIVRFLDTLTPMHITPPAGGVQYIELNRKLDDTGIRAALVGVAPEFATDYLILYMGPWAWYGAWIDKNGNGVIDELGPTCSSSLDVNTCPPVNPDDEFWWYGNCNRFPSGAGLQRGDLCVREVTEMYGWIYPGNHHTFSGGNVLGQGVTSAIVPADFPFRQALCAVDIFIGRKIVTLSDGFTGSPNPMACAGRYEDLENLGITTYGDSFLDDQTATLSDFIFADRVGDANIGTRQWVSGNGFSMPFYDQSLFQSTVIVTGVFSPLCPAKTGAACQAGALASAQYTDVDTFNSVAPVLSDLLLTTVKPALRSNWIVLRNELTALDNANDRFIGASALNRDPVKGPLDDQLLDPGFSHEPNHALDAFPVARGICADSDAQHAGWCTNYAVYQTRHAFLDVVNTRVGTSNFVFVILNNGSPVGLACILCVSGGGIGNPIGDGTPKPAGTDKHARALAPGLHLFGASLGFWTDRAQTITDVFYDPECLTTPVNSLGTCGGTGGLIRTGIYAVPADGWIGSIVNTTGNWHYRGYSTASCDIPYLGGVADREYAICHPYRDGIIQNPNAIGAAGLLGEWSGACTASSFPTTAGQAEITIIPLDANGDAGTWLNPTFVDRDWFNQRPDVSNLAPFQAKLEDKTGTGAITMRGTCAGSGLTWGDMLIVPNGNFGQRVRTIMSAQPIVSGTIREPITDVDDYVGWGA